MKISIVTPSYQQAPFILRNLQSVAQQSTLASIEHIVMDGGSQDETVNILKQAAQIMPHLQWYSERDRGQAHAINKAIQLASGDIIGWLNSDDLYCEGAFQQVLDFFNTHPAIDVLYGKADHIDEEDVPFESYPTEAWDPERLKYTCYISQPALFFRREVFEKYGLLNEALHYCLDYEYWIRLAQAHATVAFLPQKLACTRLYPDTKTMSLKIKAHEETLYMLKDKFGEVSERWILNYAFAVLEKKVDRQRFPRVFNVLLGCRVLYDMLYFNQRVSTKHLKTMLGWISPRRLF